MNLYHDINFDYIRIWNKMGKEKRKAEAERLVFQRQKYLTNNLLRNLNKLKNKSQISMTSNLNNKNIFINLF